MAKRKTAAARAAALLDRADALVIAAGAGMGVDSGLPDFRGNEGFWKAYPALARDRVGFSSIASPATFRSSADRAWGFYGHRLALYRKTRPHAGFGMLKRWGAGMAQGARVFTSNVDGAFQRAGFPEKHVAECHGSIHHLQCLHPCGDDVWKADEFVPEIDVETGHLRNAAPVCPHCGGLARPNILMFGDGGWLPRRSLKRERKLEDWLCDAARPVVIEIGAGTAIPSVRWFSDDVVRRHGGHLIRINPREADVHRRADVSLTMGGLAGLEAIAKELEGLA
jgi:NAD-dependent SIR2 family protein deacetylase